MSLVVFGSHHHDADDDDNDYTHAFDRACDAGEQ